jgi:hypothetical protein
MPWTQPRLGLNSRSHLLLSEPRSPSIDTITTTIITTTEVKMPDNTSCPRLDTTSNLLQQQFLRWTQLMDSTSDQFVMWIVCHQWFQVSTAD